MTKEYDKARANAITTSENGTDDEAWQAHQVARDLATNKVEKDAHSKQMKYHFKRANPNESVELDEGWRKTRDDSAELRNRDREGKRVTTPNGEGVIKRELKVPTFSRLKPLKHIIHVTHGDGSVGEYDGKHVKLIKEDVKMNDQTISLIDSISSGDTIASAQLFNDALMSKVSDMIDVRREEVAQSVFTESGGKLRDTKDNK